MRVYIALFKACNLSLCRSQKLGELLLTPSILEAETFNSLSLFVVKLISNRGSGLLQLLAQRTISLNAP